MTETVTGGPKSPGDPDGAQRTAGQSAPAQPGRGLRVPRAFTRDGVHPYDEVHWTRRDVVLTNWRDGSVNFEQRGVEFPEDWSVNAVNIVTSKYFRGAVGSPQRESSLRQLIDRVVDTYSRTGLEHGYFATAADAEIFNHELKWLLVHQHFSFNSPVWFNVGTPAAQFVSACQPYDALVSTPEGLVPIGKLVVDNAVGTKVFDAHGVTSVVATKSNGVKDVLRVHLKSGHTLDVTADHQVWRSTGGPDRGRFVPAGELQPGDQLTWHPTYAYGSAEIMKREIAEAALAGWLQSDGFVGQYDGTNRSLTIEAMTVTPAELEWVTRALDVVFPDVHRHERFVETRDDTLDCRRTRLYGHVLEGFVAKWSLRARGAEMRVPPVLLTAPLPAVAAYLRSLFQAEGYVTTRHDGTTRLAFDMISEHLVRGAQALLGRFGVSSRVGVKRDPRANRHDCWTLSIGGLGDRQLFAEEIGFIDPRKAQKLSAGFGIPGRPSGRIKRLQVDRVQHLGPMEVYDIQTESGEYLSANLRVHNCFILSVDDTMDSILNWYREEGLIFKGGSGAGVNLSRIRSSKELLSSGGTASGPVSFMRGADSSAGTIKSGGATRRAAKMVVLDVDHPDIEEFVETKAREEHKIRALRDAGFDMDLGGRDIVSAQYQNANNSVRVTDEFMRAVADGKQFGLRARQDNRVIEEVDARELFRTMAQAAWGCADPGIQYDDTINDWHTNPESGRITASNPCFPADQRVVTDKGLIRIADLVKRAATGEAFDIYTNDVTAAEQPADRVVATRPVRYLVTGTNEIVELRFSNGSRLRCTPRHRLWTTNRGWVHADELTQDDRVARSTQYAGRPFASDRIPARALQAAGSARGRSVSLSEKWTSEFAHYLGWVVGDGCVTDQGVVAVYGSDEDREAVLPRHQRLLRDIVGFDAKPSAQPNGTVQLRTLRSAMVEFARALGLSSGRAADKVVPEAIFEAPEVALTAFLRGLYDADGCVVNQEVKGTRYVGLGSRSEELVLGVQELLDSLGIASTIYTMPRKGETFRYTRKDGSQATYGTEGPSYDLRLAGHSIAKFARLIGFSLPTKAEKLDDVLANHRFYDTDESLALVSRKSKGFETTYNLTEPRNHSYIVSGVVVANCSEYLSLDNSSCNLASLNLMKFRREDNTFDAEKFAKVVELVTTAMDISICFADFPTEAIGQTTRDYRQLGIGYCNLGALLMATGHAYDSDGGRTMAGAITSLMTGTAYKRSAELAGIVGPYAGYARNAAAHTRVMRKHAAAGDAVRPVGADDAHVLQAAGKAWQECLDIGNENGWRNAQASVLAPTGTISFFMDSDTTGVEPDLALVKYKKLADGGSMQIVNRTVPLALRSLGYHEEQVEAIVDYVAETGTVVDAPGMRPEHYEVFDCAIGDRAISWMGHVRMLAAVQPFISGSVSKTVNLPESATVEDIEKAYFEGWRLGLKALAVYRDNCKVGQPLSAGKSRKAAAEVAEAEPVRKRLPKVRPSQTVSFAVGGAEGYMTASSYPDNGLGEVFLKMSKQGSTLAGVMDAFSIAISIALQYGVPLETYVSKFINMRFDPAGMTDDPDVRIAQSVVDYIFRRLALDYLPYETRAQLGVFTAAERTAAASTTAVPAAAPPATAAQDDDEGEVDVESLRSSAPIEPHHSEPSDPAQLTSSGSQTTQDAPLCLTCGVKMRPSGSCYVCESCGSTSGCS